VEILDRYICMQDSQVLLVAIAIVVLLILLLVKKMSH